MEKTNTFVSESDEIITIFDNNYHGGLRRYIARRLKRREDIDDVTQEVYLRFFRNYKLDDLKSSLTLLRKIAAHVLIDRFRRDKVRAVDSHIALEDAVVESREASPEQMLWTKEVLEKFKREFNKLNKNTRKAFVLHRFRGLTYDEIALEMGISKSMVYKHLSKVMLHMANNLEIENE